MTQIAHTARFDSAVDVVHAAFTDETYWQRRLAEIGGPGARLGSLTEADRVTTVQIVHAIAAKYLPSMVTAIRPGDLVIERTDTWGPVRAGIAEGAFDARVDGTPAAIGGRHSLRADGAGCVLQLDGQVEVKIPLVGGRIEAAIVGQLERLLDGDDAFTAKWLADRG